MSIPRLPDPISGVLFITDSIGYGEDKHPYKGYTAHLQDMMQIPIARLPKNSMGTPQILDMLEANGYAEYPSGEYNTVFINAGLWDSNGKATPQLTPEQYYDNCVEITKQLRSLGYQVQWMNTTHTIIHEVNTVVDEFNAKLTAMQHVLDVPVYGQLWIQEVMGLTTVDGVHFDPASVIIQAEKLQYFIGNRL